MSVAKAQREIGSREFTYWAAWYKYHCLDTEGWEQTATLCATIASSQGAKVKPDDFMPIDKLPQTPDEMWAQLMRSAPEQTDG